ncbi:MAG TPA: MarR family winged helix-turn-helix transcriptional regulator [Burkholderiales bacterium]|nr:MarR family winged helix-turn-helix transcriptional regulator [Burkholderiales bacterium]
MPRKNRKPGLPPALSPSDYARLAAFRYSLRRFLHFSEAAAARVGLTGQQYQAMLVVRARAAPVSINDLARELLIRHHSAVGLVDRLAAHGHLVRDRDRADRRRVLIRLTPKGERELRKLVSVHRRKLRRIGPEIHRILGELAGAWREEG